MKIRQLACTCLCALLVPFTLRAQAPATDTRPLIGGHGHNVETFIAQHDGNNDGTITWTEFETFRRARFDETDSSHDGTVDEDEYVREFDARMHAQLDQERAAQVRQTRIRFAALDTDGNALISPQEFAAAGEKTWAGGQRVLAEKHASTPGYRPGEAKTAESAARFDNAGGRLRMPTTHSAEGFLALYDEDDDGKVERAEFDRARDAQFARTDSDRSGTLDVEEYLAEYQVRVDRRVATLTQGEDRQVYVRFGVLDADKDQRMSFAEYQISGRRLFETADRNHDGVVDAADAKLPPPSRRTAG